jgi:hypothetical protein
VPGAAEPAWYVYGIVPEDVELAPDASGVGDPPGQILLVRHGDVAALVSEIPAPHQLRRTADLAAHRDLLDAAAAEVPVLPVRFGTVVASREAVAGELLSPHHDEFAAALRDLEGRAEYLIEARYDGQAGEAEPGEAIGDAIAGEVSEYCAATRVRECSDEDGADVAVLADTARQGDLERAIGKLADDWEGRVSLRLRGPMAPYDFVAELAPDR